MSTPRLCDQHEGLKSQVLGVSAVGWTRPFQRFFHRCDRFESVSWGTGGIPPSNQTRQPGHTLCFAFILFTSNTILGKMVLLVFLLLFSTEFVHGSSLEQGGIRPLGERGTPSGYEPTLFPMEVITNPATNTFTTLSTPTMLSTDGLSNLITMATWNIRRKFIMSLPKILAFMHDNSVQVLALQETGINASAARHELSKYSKEYTAYFTSQLGLHSGAGIIISKKLAHHVQTCDYFPGRVVTIILAFSNHELRITSVYWPANYDYDQWPQLNQYLTKLLADDIKNSRHSILLGDWNEDKARTSRPEGQSALDLLELHGFKDVSQDSMSTKNFLTFYRKYEESYEPLSRIDGIWITPALQASIKHSWGVPADSFDFTMTDHVPVLCTFYNEGLCPTLSLKSKEIRRILALNDATKEQLDDFKGFVHKTIAELQEKVNPAWFCPDQPSDVVMGQLDIFVNELQLSLMNCAHTTLPKKTLGRPKPLVSYAHPLQKGYKLIHKLIYSQNNLQQSPTLSELTTLDELAAAASLSIPPIATVTNVTTKVLKTYRNHFQKAHAKLVTTETAKSIKQALQNRHELFSAGAIKKVLNSVLERNKSHTTVDRIHLKDAQGHPYKAFDAATVLKEVEKGFSNQFRARTISAFKEGSVFQSIFTTDATIKLEWYSNLMDNPTEEEITQHLESMRKGKAPGPSGLTVEILQSCSSSLIPLLKSIYTICFIHKDIPPTWGQKTIFPIPKKEDWAGDITALRPISLSEVLAKLFQKIWTTRLTNILMQHSILKGHNTSVLPGTSTSQALGIIQHVIDQAVTNQSTCFLLLNDIAKAFDSVPIEGLARACRRLGIPESYIQMRRNMHKHMVARVVTAFGLTDPFQLGSAVQQGDCNAPLDWLIFWDPLLCAIQQYTEGVKFQTQPLHDMVPIPTMATSIASVAFVDDTTTMATSLRDLKHQISLLLEYQEANSIKSNVKKIAVLAFNPPTKCPATLPWGEEGSITIYTGDHTERVLGNYFNCKGSAEPTKTNILQATQQVVALLGNKKISDKIVIYIMNRVLIPKLQYLWKTQILNTSFLETVDAKIRSCVKRKIGLKSSTPNSVLYNAQIYNLTSVVQQHHLDIINTMLQQLNDNTILGTIARISLFQLQKQCATTQQPLSRPFPIPSQTPVGFFGKAMRFLHHYGFSFQALRGNTQLPSDLHPIEDALPWPTLNELRSARSTTSAIFIEQLTSADNSAYLNKYDLKRQGYSSDHCTLLLKVIQALQSHHNVTPFEHWQLASYNRFHQGLRLNPQSTPHKVGTFAVFKIAETFQMVQIKKIINNADGQQPLGEVRHLRQATQTDVHPDRKMMAKLQQTPRQYLVECQGCQINNKSVPGFCHLTLPLTSGTSYHCEPVAKLFIANASMYQARHRTNNLQFQDVEEGYRLLYKITTKLTPSKVTATADEPNEEEAPQGPNNLSPWPNVTIKNVQHVPLDRLKLQTLLNNGAELSIYTDGSVKGSRQGMGIYCPDVNPPVALSLYLPPMVTSSYIAELGALIIGHLVAGHNKATIYLDNQAVVTDYCKLTNNLCHAMPSQLLKTPAAYMWSLLLTIRNAHPEPNLLKVKWIKGHADNQGNIMADKLAGSPGLLTSFDYKTQNHLHYQLLCNGVAVEGHIRQMLKAYIQIINYYKWATQPLFGISSIHLDLDHILTYLLLHSGTKPTALFSTLSESHRRRFRVQLMHRILPTQKEMHRRYPAMYPNGYCRVCHSQEETQEHLLECPYFTTVYNTLKDIIAAGLADACSSKQSSWAQKEKWLSLDEFKPPQTSNSNWNFSYILRGFVPNHWMTNLKEAGTPHQSAFIRIYKTMDEALTQLHDNMWLQRCDHTIAWEEQQHITPTQKQQHSQPAATREPRAKGKRTVYPQCTTCGRTNHPANICTSEMPSNLAKSKIWAAHFTNKSPLSTGILNLPTPTATKLREATNERLKRHTRPKRPQQQPKLTYQAHCKHAMVKLLPATG